MCLLQVGLFSALLSKPLICALQDKEIYRWPIKESIKAMIAWEWTLDKARDGDEDKGEKKAARKISQTAQVQRGGGAATVAVRADSGWSGDVGDANS